MGFVHNRKLIRLVFEGELEGLEVTVRPSSVLVYDEIAELSTQTFTSPPSRENLKALRDLYRRFAAVLVSWNLEEAGEDGAEVVPVPATLDGLLSQEPSFVNSVVTAWLDAAALTERDRQAAAKAAQAEADALFELEESLPVEPLPS